MRIELNHGNKLLTGFGMNIIAPLLITMGAVVVIALATPVLLAAAVVVVGIAFLMAGTTVTREAPIDDEYKNV
ncbi:MAG: hypothetical protein CL902_07665 [Dehalococcoidia bacterium]|nr:hypothetical protein [Dehalococcoidia bacterium]